MNTYVPKKQERKDLSIANNLSGQKNKPKRAIRLVNNSPEAVVQKKLQDKITGHSPVKQLSAASHPLQKSINNTGLPGHLKTNVEHLSGYSMDDVKVHYNSEKPARLQAHAYAQGANIYLGRGQEKHLAHEAWHVVQQKQGRVKPVLQMKTGVSINDNTGLEKEADIMGAKAMHTSNVIQAKGSLPVAVAALQNEVVQRQIQLVDADDGLYEETEDAKATPKDTEFYYCKIQHNLKPLFVLKSFLDPLETRIDVIDGNDDLNIFAKEQGRMIELLSAAKNALFYTDDGDVTGAIKEKQFRLKMALGHPLYKDPDRTRGLQHRFADPDGVLFSKLPKTKVEEKLGILSPGISFYLIPPGEWKAEVAKFKDFWTEVSGDFAYGRHANKRDITPRNARSKFRKGTNSSVNKDDFSGDLLAAALPPSASTKTDSDWIKYTRYANPKDRGKGQFKAMNNWNALAYAAYMSHHGHPGLQLDQDWEWLHIHGAQNGGATNKDNLVAGTSTTNSRMIPWEDTINSWTNQAKPAYPLSVRFLGEREPGTNLGKKIEIRVAAENGIPGLLKPVSKDSPMHLIFDPLNGTAYDKMSNKLTADVITEEAFDDTYKRNQEAKVRGFLNTGTGLKRLRIIGKSVYKGYQAEFKRYYNDEALVFVVPAMRDAIVPLWQLEPEK
ncbi:MAG: DUF4157 domain-containing protein [Chitinophagaceae bacterium]